MVGQVYHMGAEVEIVGGDIEEGWAIIQHSDDDDLLDVDIGELKAESGYETIREKIDSRKTFMGEAYEDYLPLNTRYPKESLVITTVNHQRLVDVDFFEETKGTDEYGFIEGVVMGAIQQLDMAHRQPRRMLFRNREVLD